MKATAVYRLIMLEIERRRLHLGLSHETLNDLAGVQDGYLAKMVHADAASGRQARWETLQDVLDALFPLGMDIILREKIGPPTSAQALKRSMRFAQALTTRRTQRELMRELSALGQIARSKAVNASRRKQIAKKAARARWSGTLPVKEKPAVVC